MDQDDISDYLPRWQEKPALWRNDDSPDARPPQPVASDVWADADSVPQFDPPPVFGTGVTGDASGGSGLTGPTGPTGPPGPTGPKGETGDSGYSGYGGRSGYLGGTGARGSMGISPRGSRGAAGARGDAGFSGYQGRSGVPGMQGPIGPTGPSSKASVVQTAAGNVVFSCIEGARPIFFDVLRGRGRLELREEFVASIAPGSAFVFAIAPAGAGARIEGGNVECGMRNAESVGDTPKLAVVVDGDADAVVMVAGIDRRFPDWDLPVVTEDVRRRSREFWAREWGLGKVES